jgi:hypothetical protein
MDSAGRLHSEKNFAERAVVLAHRPDIAPAPAEGPWLSFAGIDDPE